MLQKAIMYQTFFFYTPKKEANTCERKKFCSSIKKGISFSKALVKVKESKKYCISEYTIFLKVTRRDN